MMHQQLRTGGPTGRSGRWRSLSCWAVVALGYGLLAASLTGCAAPGRTGTRSDTAAPTSRYPAIAAATEQIIAAALQDTFAYDWLQTLCDRVGHRLAGSPGMQAAVELSAHTMRQAGLDSVWLEPVTVPYWIRGHEAARCTAPRVFEMPVLAMGFSDGTGPDGIEAEVLAVRDFDELEARADEAPGKIVLFNPPWTGYGGTVRYRTAGASAAARHGAVACLIRSVTNRSLSTPHTGMMRYADDAPRIPGAALTVEDAARLFRLCRRGERVRVHLQLGAENRGEITCHNVIGDLKGREQPEQIVVIGGHLDSWDVGTCAHDDGAGCAVTFGAIQLLKQLDLRPRRTVRLVHFTGEEFGGHGGRAYHDAHAHELDDHVAAFESDSGCFPPRWFSISAPDSLVDTVVAQLTGLLGESLAPLGVDEIKPGWSGVDIRPVVDAGAIGIGHRMDNPDYFDYHHSPADTFDKIDLEIMRRNVAAVAALIYAIAESPASLRDGSVLDPGSE